MQTLLTVATQYSESDFFTKSSLGMSLTKFSPDNLIISLYANNTKGLSERYNQSIDWAKDTDMILIFCHDDVTIMDYYFLNRVNQGLENFDIVGLIGNKSRIEKQPGWAFSTVIFEPKFDLLLDRESNFSGVWGDGWELENFKIHSYLPTNQRVKLLDGFFIAVKSQTLAKNDLRFDEQFKFHFYDMDFCRSAEVKGLTCGTIDLFLLHGKKDYKNTFFTPIWLDNYNRYIDKWKV